MLLTIAIAFVVLAAFLLLMYNMYSDYQARKEADIRAIVNRARNIISETEELLLNQAQIPYSKTITLILRYRIINCLKKLKLDPHAKNVDARIADQMKYIADIQKNAKEDLAFRPPENDRVAVAQLRAIRKLRKIMHAELRSGTPVNIALCQKEDKRLSLLVLKVNISNLIQTVLEMKRLHQVGTCRQLIEKGLDVISKSGIKDDWLMERSDYLTQISQDIDNEIHKKAKAKIEKNPEQAEVESEINELFGDKKK